jgi:hypothetical protein
MRFVRMNEEEEEKKEEKVGGNVKFKYYCTDTEPGLGGLGLGTDESDGCCHTRAKVGHSVPCPQAWEHQ